MTLALVDTSVWVDFLRSGDSQLTGLLEANRVCMHSMIVGELACGNLRQRKELLMLWNNLSRVIEASHQEALFFLEQNRLMGRGIGYIDLHLLASVALSPDSRLWTRDKRLQKIAAELKLSFV